MSEEVSKATWRKRFILINLLQIAGTLIALFGLLLWQSSYIVRGGHWSGFMVSLIGLVISFFGPRRLARHWKSRSLP